MSETVHVRIDCYQICYNQLLGYGYSLFHNGIWERFYNLMELKHFLNTGIRIRQLSGGFCLGLMRYPSDGLL